MSAARSRLRRGLLMASALLAVPVSRAQPSAPTLDEVRSGIETDLGIAVRGNPSLQALSVLRQSMGLFTPEQRSGLSEVIYTGRDMGSIQGLYTTGEEGRGRIELAPSGAENLRTVTFLGTQHVGVQNGATALPDDPERQGLVQEVLGSLPEGEGAYPTAFSRSGRMAQFGEVVTSWMLEPLGQSGARRGWTVPAATDELLRSTFPAARPTPTVPPGDGLDPFSVLPGPGAGDAASPEGSWGGGLLGMDLGLAPSGGTPPDGPVIPADEQLPGGT